MPSLEDATPDHFCVLSVGLTSVHVAPEFADVQMCPPLTVAASLVPSLDDVMSNQARALAADWPSDHVSLFVHVPQESADVQMYPLSATAASLVPSLDDVMPLHPCPIRSASPVGVQLTPESIDV